MRTSGHRITILTAALLLACVALIAGCSSSSGPSESDDPGATSPAEVLANLKTAYEYMNADDFLDCLSEDFKFHFSEEDVQNPGLEIPPYFYKSDERQVHENIFAEGSGVESITLTLMPTSVETIPGGGSGRPTGDRVIMRVDADLRMSVSGGMTYLATSSQEFHFREVADKRDRDEVVLWEMFEWYELDDPTGNGRGENTTWGRIKSLYLEFLSEPSHRTSPAEVLEQLEAAYIAMDANSYLDCLSENFIFYPSEADVQDPDLDIPSEWYKNMEQIIHFNMFSGESNVESIQLTLTNTLIFWDEQDPEDPTDDIYSHTEDVDLRVTVLGSLTYVATDPSMYLLRVDPDEVGPYDELMWEIYEWYDLGDPGRGDASEYREYTSWGVIKALYR